METKNDGGVSRRSALQLGGALLAAGAALGIGKQAQAQAVTDADILNFALNLEYLEAEFYLRAVGRTLSPGDIGANPGAVTGGSTVTFDTPALREYVEELARDEEAHVKYIRTVLLERGFTPVPRPAIDLSNSFNAAAAAAGLGPAFNPYANELFFAVGSFIFEDVGVTAYKGGSPLIQNKGILDGAAGILAVEAYHAATIRVLLHELRDTNVPAFGRTVGQVVQAVSDLRDSVDGADDRDQGITGNTTGNGAGANIVPTDANGIAFSRTTSQVLRIVYLGGTSNGGFFPNGLNGTIRTA